jgi:hypothetical protein
VNEPPDIPGIAGPSHARQGRHPLMACLSGCSGVESEFDSGVGGS